MYKQITETFEPTLTFGQKYFETDFLHYNDDKVLFERCQEISDPMLKAGMPINKICELVRDFQCKYMHIDMCDKNVSKDYTVRVWARMNDDMIEVHK